MAEAYQIPFPCRYFPDLDVALALSANMIPIDPDVGNIADEISNIVIDHLKKSIRRAGTKQCRLRLATG